MAIRVTRQALEVLHPTKLPIRVTRQAVEVLWQPSGAAPVIPVIGNPLSETFGYRHVRQDGQTHLTQRSIVRVEGQADVLDSVDGRSTEIVGGAPQRLDWALAGDVDDGDGGDADAWAHAQIVVATGTGPISINGLVPTPQCPRKLFVWAGTDTLTFVDEAPSSAADNRLALPGNLTLAEGEAAWLLYVDG